MDTQQIADLVTAGKWLPLLTAFAWAMVRLLKSDTKLPDRFNIPPKWRPLAATGFALLAATIGKVAAGSTWRSALVAGLASGGSAFLFQFIAVDVARDGKDLPLPAALTKPEPAPAPEEPKELP